jgi:membrane protein implicated in regulation of membrane protease activity
MVGLVLGLIVVAIALSLVGQWIVSIPVGVVAVLLFVRFVAGWGRRTATRNPDAPA